MSRLEKVDTVMRASLLGLVTAGLAAAECLALDMTAFGGQCDGLTDNTPALNAAIAAAQGAVADKVIRLPAGQCLFKSQPAALADGVALIGQGKTATVLQRAYNGNFLRITGEGVRVENLTIWANAGTTGGIGIEMLASDALGPGGNHVIRSVWISGEGKWTIPLGAWGHERNAAPAGIRAVMLQDVSVFNATWQAMTFWGCVSCEWFGGGAYQGFGTTQAIVIGGRHAYRNRVDANIDWPASTVYPGVMRPPT
jgi:hypothetical protein